MYKYMIQKELVENLSVSNKESSSKIKDNEVIIGQKPFMNYVRSVELMFRNKGMREITIRGRGMSVSKAVDLAESVKNKFCQDLKLNISNIRTSTEMYQKEDRDFSISVIELTIKRT